MLLTEFCISCNFHLILYNWFFVLKFDCLVNYEALSTKISQQQCATGNNYDRVFNLNIKFIISQFVECYWNLTSIIVYSQIKMQNGVWEGLGRKFKSRPNISETKIICQIVKIFLRWHLDLKEIKIFQS